jgi:(p)ppGpp synthase/HD superfamily hydrolase
MHLVAERGVAAHFRYKHPGAAALARAEARWVYPLTPRGEVRRLPRGATALDFAYAIHTDLGRGYTGARIGERLVRLETPLATGDVVHILHSARARPTERQLARVRTARARNRIRAELRARREGPTADGDEARASRRDPKPPCREAARHLVAGARRSGRGGAAAAFRNAAGVVP